MKKSILLWMVLLFTIALTLPYFASAVLNDAEGYYNFDLTDITGSTLEDISGNGYDMTCYMDSACDSLTTKLVNGSDFNSNDYVSDLDAFDIGSNEFTYMVVVNFTSLTTSRAYVVFAKGNAGTGVGGIMHLQKRNNPETLRFGLFDGGWQWAEADVVEANRIYHIVVTRNSTDDVALYINSTWQSSFNDNVDFDSDRDFYFGVSDNNGVLDSQLDGIIDEFGYWTRALSQSEIDELWNGGDYINPYSAGADPAAPILFNVTFPHEGNAYNNYINITWNESVDPNGDAVQYNVSMYNTTDYIYFINTSDLDYQFLSTTYADGNYTINITACDPTYLCNNSYRNFTIDNTLPVANIVYPTNDTVIYAGVPFEYTATASDNNKLYSTNLSCDNFSDYRSELYVGYYAFSNTTNITDYGFQECTFTVCDSHTLNVISDKWQKSYTPETKTISFDNTLDIILDKSVAEVSFKYATDRYTFCITPFVNEDSLTFTMPEECVVVPDSTYNGHFVCYDKYWIDFDPYPVTIYNNDVLLDLDGYKEDTFCFESVGSLNCNNDNIKFFVQNDTDPPVVSLITPINKSNLTTGGQFFNYSNAEILGIQNCTFYVNDVFVDYNANVLNNSFDNFTYTIPIVGYYNWSVTCLDDLNISGSSDVWFFNVSVVGVANASGNYTFSLGECPDDSIEVSFLFIGLMFFCLIFMLVGFFSDYGFIGIIGSLGFLAGSYYVLSCFLGIGVVFFVIGLLGMISIIIKSFS